jgi:hypothetical protein
VELRLLFAEAGDRKPDVGGVCGGRSESFEDVDE